MKLTKERVLPIIMNALSEDMGSGDITSSVIFEKDENIMADIVANEECVFAGSDIARWIFDSLDERVIFRPLCNDGDNIRKGKRVISLKGSIRNILAGERTVLNFLGRLSGISTLANRIVKKVKRTGVKIFDTRKTTPGLRTLEKYAVKVGGGYNHRMGLWDGILIKDNHLDGSQVTSRRSRLRAINDAVTKAKQKGYKNVEIEVCNLKEFKIALEAGADIIMLDNMHIEDVRKAVRLSKSGPLLEVSGNITLENVARIAKTGVDRISIGSLTHSAPSIDFSLEICK